MEENSLSLPNIITGTGMGVNYYHIFNSLLVVWRFRSKGWRLALYNGAVAALFTLFLYEILFNITGRFPPTGNLPPWGIGLMVLFLAEKHVIADTPKQTPTSRQREWAEKAVKRYAEAQEKKWRNWNEAMFEPN